MPRIPVHIMREQDGATYCAMDDMCHDGFIKPETYADRGKKALRPGEAYCQACEAKCAEEALTGTSQPRE